MTADRPGQGELSLEQIEQDSWGDAPPGASTLIRTAHQLRRKAVRDLTAEELRLLLSQQIGVETLTPRAVGLLRQDPLAEGDYYPGDLLTAVMKLPSAYWGAHPEHLKAVQEIARSVEEADAELLDDIERFLARTSHAA